MPGTVERPARKGGRGQFIGYRKRCDPMLLRCVDVCVGKGNETEVWHGLPPRNAAQFKNKYVAFHIFL